jgi:hypothetical protein
MANFGIFTDPTLVSPLSAPLSFTIRPGAEDSATAVMYFGSTDTQRLAQAASNPGVDHIYVSIVDSTPATGLQAIMASLGSSESAAVSATPGAPLDLGTEILGGLDEVKAIWICFDVSRMPAVPDLGIYTDIRLVYTPMKIT